MNAATDDSLPYPRARSAVSANAISGAFNYVHGISLGGGFRADIVHCQVAFVRINCVSLSVGRRDSHTWLRVLCMCVCMCVYKYAMYGLMRINLNIVKG